MKYPEAIRKIYLHDEYGGKHKSRALTNEDGTWGIFSIDEIVGGQFICTAKQFKWQMDEEAYTEGEGESLPNSPIDEHKILG